MMDAGAFFFWLGIASGIALIVSEMILACIPPKKNSSVKKTYPPFTIIVAARNEEAHLPVLLNSLSKLDYPAYKILIALDRCTDNSKNIVRDAMRHNPNIDFLEIKEISSEGWSPKKFALNAAIEKADTEWLAFTDADCEVQPDWLQSFAENCDAETDVIPGVSPYRKYPGILNAFIRYETARTAFMYVQATHLGLPYMAVGRSMAYRKSFFKATDGFEGFREILSGDDDLLVSRKSVGKRTKVTVKSPVISEPPRKVSTWITQKVRHLSSSRHYAAGRAILPLWLNLCHSIFYLSLGVTVVSGAFAIPLWLILFVRWISGITFMYWRARPLVSIDILLAYPLLDVLLFFYHLILLPPAWLGKVKWKK